MLLIALAAVVDHHHTNAAIRPALDAPWYCADSKVRCKEARWELAVDRRWHIRESRYKAAFASVGAATLLLALVVWSPTSLDIRRRETTGRVP